MYLKSLKLVGFKSFADRTRLELRPGVTVVVGPNGSGKSNIVDAVSWVMGTQSAKALRTSKMEDVVFAGTATRPALNRAEATVIIDNSDRVLDLDLDEVAITRRLYRDGSSDYELNGVACRLLDIEELLSDSGVGRHQHVIIGQGQVDRVLNASPEDHRAVIEEAAGILKHRKRKEKAERRLERTDEDLVRLTDLIGEIERQMRPLRRQARAAEKYQDLKDEVVSLTLYLSRCEIEGIDEEVATSEKRHSELHRSISAAQEKITKLSAEVQRQSARAGGVGADLERDSSAAAVLETTSERLRRLAGVAHERRRALAGRRQAADERRTDLEEERHLLIRELDELAGSRPEVVAMVDGAEEEFRRLDTQQESIAAQSALSPEGALAAVRGELLALDNAAGRDRREAESLAARLEAVSSQREIEAAAAEQLNEEIRRLDTRIADAQAEYQRAAARRETDQQAWIAAEERWSEARLAVAGAEARIEGIRAAVTEQFDEETRELVEAAPGALGSLIGRLDVPGGLEAAVEAALGLWAGAVAFESAPSLESAVEELKSGGLGGVPVVVAVSPGASAAQQFAATHGVDALVDLLGDRADVGLACRLLGDVVLVEGWAAGWRLVSKNPGLRAVTPEGDLIGVSGIRCAHPDGAGVVMLEKAEVALEKALTEASRAGSTHTAARRDFERSREVERQALEALEAIEAELAGCTEAMDRHRKSADALGSEAGRLEARLVSLRHADTARDEHAQQLRARVGALEGEEAERMRAWEELETRRVEVAARREAARSVWQEASERLRAIDERMALHQERIDRIADDVNRLGGEVAPSDSGPGLELVENSARAAVEALESRIGELRERQANLRAENAEALASLELSRADHEATRNGLEADREALAGIEVRLTELRMRREAVAERLRRDADSTPEAAASAPRPPIPEGADLEQRLGSSLAQLQRLGPVNPLAAAEYAELEGRHTFLAEQMADVESSRHELRKVIAALDEEIEARFEKAFTEVAEGFQKYFSILFPGGKGRIRLLDPDDPRSGLEIQAQPLGKKVSHLSLLSGGEKSLAALAFLFSVFEARPSPFYILDEVEAALDDANLRRFLKIVDEFRRQAQLVIITHQQQTMEAADVLYGVTMEPGGSSKVVRKEMAQASTQVA